MKVINYRTLTQQRLAVEQEAIAEQARGQAAFTTVEDLIEMTTPEYEQHEELDRIAQEADDDFNGLVVMQNIVEANGRIEGEPTETELRMASLAMEAAFFRLGLENEIVPYGSAQAKSGNPADEKKRHAGMMATIKSIVQRGIEIIIAALKRVKDWFVDFYDMVFGEAKSLVAKTEKLAERFKKVNKIWNQYEGKTTDQMVSAGELMSVGILNHEFNITKIRTAINQINDTGKNYEQIAGLIPGLGGAVSDGDADMVKTFVNKIGALAVKTAEKFRPRHGLDMMQFANKLEKSYRGYELVGPTFVYFPELTDKAMEEIKQYAGHQAEKDVTEGRSGNTDVQHGIQILRKFALRAQSKFDIGGRLLMKATEAQFKVLDVGSVSGIIDIVDNSARALVGSRGAGRDATKTADKLLSDAQKQRAELTREADKDDAALKAMNGRVNNLVAFNSAVTYMLFQSVRDLDSAGINVAKALFRLANANVTFVEKLSAKAA